ncbi:class I SAM-dependent methyltransferase [Streptomyces sp. NPDC091281]|uniref:class I SAM-dependent methyltransferase n=1 Tax=Streptomyces sp. NPDC091281 TaxID=3365985 RepID=UPI0038153910
MSAAPATSAAPGPGTMAAFEAAKGFMPADEGRALYAAAVEAAALGLPLLEVGTYCGRSTILLADAARRAGVTALTVDHHRGSEEQQPGWAYHDPTTVDPEVGLMDTLPTFRRTLHRAGLEEHVVALVGRSPQIAAFWNTPLGLVFVDGGHTDEHAGSDYEGWAPHVAEGGLLVLHDVFPDPADEFTGQAPYRVYLRALASGAFTETAVTGSLRVLRRTGPHTPPTTPLMATPTPTPTVPPTGSAGGGTAPGGGA